MIKVGRNQGEKYFVDVVVEGEMVDVVVEPIVFQFKSSSDVRDRLKKAYIGEVLFPGETHNLQTHFAIEGVFSIKISPLGPNLCVLEELDEGIIEELVCESSLWWKQWFRFVRPWKKSDIDSERVLWIKVFRVPCQAWSVEFFISVANNLGNYIWVDEVTA